MKTGNEVIRGYDELQTGVKLGDDDFNPARMGQNGN
jgi:hypothetical protein